MIIKHINIKIENTIKKYNSGDLVLDEPIKFPKAEINPTNFVLLNSLLPFFFLLLF